MDSICRMADTFAMKPDSRRVLDVRPDSLDFRDLMYTPTLVEVPTVRDLADYRKARVPILDQGTEGACTGFGLASVVHYLMRVRHVGSDATLISPYMLYDIARRYDEWSGESYDGSSCRGAMKGWQKHGVCDFKLWPATGKGQLTESCVNDAARRPLGAYFRVNHRDLVAMHAAITEVGALYVSSSVHSGWRKVAADGHIRLVDDNIGGHAFAIVAYDSAGFWLQNSWGGKWGKAGFGHLSYEDWLKNGTDAWVARLAVPVQLQNRSSTSRRVYGGSVRAKAYSYADLRPHVISLGNDGLLEPHGNIGTTPELVHEIISNDIPRITSSWARKRIVLYAHGGLVNEDSALQRIADYRQPMLDAQCYPLAFIWHSDAWSTIKDLLDSAVGHRRPEGILEGTKDFMLDRLDDALEPLARILGGKSMWSEMKRNALNATATPAGGARLVLNELHALAAQDSSYEFHLIGHSAGSIFHAPVVQYLTNNLGLTVQSATLWAPAITTELFKSTWLPAMPKIKRFALFTLDDLTEQDDDCAAIYHKSLLYLVSNAFEKTVHVPVFHPDGEPILGMQKFIDKDPQLRRLFGPNGAADWVRAPNSEPQGSASASRARHHNAFDDDEVTVMATLARILNRASVNIDFSFLASGQKNRAVRRRIDQMQDATMTR